MWYKFGDKEINIEKVAGLSEPKYEHLFDPHVDVYYIGGVIPCYFKELEERVWYQGKGHGLKLLNGEIEFSDSPGTTNYPNFENSVCYKLIMDEIKKLQEVIDSLKVRECVS